MVAPRGRPALILLVLTVACSANVLDGTGIDCDPMAYQINNEVWVLESGETRRLSESGMIGANPAVSPDGDEVAFTSGMQEADLDLYVVDVDGSNRRSVWHESIQSSVDWSPDGSILVFDQYSEDGIDVPLQIFTIPSEGSAAPSRLTEGAANGKPRWGSDGRILFLSLRVSEEQEIYSMNADGSDPINLTNNPARDVLPDLSPDGSTIVFASDRANSGNFDIWAMDADGWDLRQLTARAGRETNPTWTSDGKHIIYRSDESPAGLWYLSPDGSNDTPLLGRPGLPVVPDFSTTVRGVRPGDSCHPT